MQVVVFEPDHQGHRFPYVRYLLSALLEMPCDVIVAITPDGQASEQFADQLAPFAGKVRFEAMLAPLKGSPLQTARQKLANLRNVLREFRPDHLMVPSADGLTQILGAMRWLGRPVLPQTVYSEGAMHAGIFAFPGTSVVDRLKRRLVLRSIQASPWNDLLYVNPVVYEYIQRHCGGLARRTRILPDPIDSVEPRDAVAARRELGLPLEGRYAGCAGAMNARKGISLLLRAFSAAGLRRDDRLLLAGRLNSELRNLVQGEYSGLLREGRLQLIDRYLSHRELELSLAAMDVVCAPYPTHVGISNIALRAAAAGRMVLGSDYGWLGSIVPRCELGITCEVRDVDRFATALCESLDRAPGFSHSPIARRLMQFHTPENFAASFTMRLRERLGLPAARDQKPWEWVLHAETASPARARTGVPA